MLKLRVVGLLLFCFVLAAACSNGDSAPNREPADHSPLSTAAPPLPTPLAIPSSTAPPTPPEALVTQQTSTPEPEATPVPPGPDCAPSQSSLAQAPTEVVAALQAASQHPGFDGHDVSVSVWIEGWGEVLAVNPDLQLVPASNQKLLVAIASGRLLDPARRLRTSFELLDTELVLRAAADPTLLGVDIDAMAAQIVSAGVTEVDRLVIDVAPYPQTPRASGWLDFQIPTFVGPLSALMIDDNRWTASNEFLTDPARVNAERVRAQLAEAGVVIDSTLVEPRPAGLVLAEHLSPTIGELLKSTLMTSDNQIADLLLMEIGRATAGEGTLVAGASAVEVELAALCARSEGIIDDGSGLSRLNQRSARQLQELLREVDQETGATLRSQLPASGISGTLLRRFAAQDAGRVQAKTGTLLDARTLSGYATTDSGREVVFSILVNGDRDQVGASLAAIDAVVNAVLRVSS